MLLSARGCITVINQLTKRIQIPGRELSIRGKIHYKRKDRSVLKCWEDRLEISLHSHQTTFEAWSSHSDPASQFVYMNWHHRQWLFHQCLTQIVFVCTCLNSLLESVFACVKKREWNASVCVHTETLRLSVCFLNSLHFSACCWWAPLSHSAIHRGHGDSQLQNITTNCWGWWNCSSKTTKKY